MTVTSAVKRGQRLAERTMTSQCTITRAGGGERDYDPATLTYTDPEPQQIYSGKCRVKPQGRLDRPVDAGEQPITVYRLILHLPVSAPEVHVNDLVHVTSSQLDPTLPGLVVRVREVPFGDQLTARRIAVEVVAR